MTDKKLEILVVEDRIENIERAKTDLMDRGHLVIAETYKDAITALENTPFDVVITDERIPFAAEPVYPIYENKFTGRPLPFGGRIVLYALAKGVPFVSMFTDTNHHSDEIAAAQDELLEMCRATGELQPIRIGGSQYLEGWGSTFCISGVKTYSKLFDCLTESKRVEDRHIVPNV